MGSERSGAHKLWVIFNQLAEAFDKELDIAENVSVYNMKQFNTLD